MPSPEQDHWIQDVLGLAPGGARGRTPDAAGPDTAAFATLGTAWGVVEQSIRRDMATLAGHVADSYSDDPAAPEAAKVFQQHVDGIFAIFDTTLAADLEAAASAGSAQELDRVRADLRKGMDTLLGAIQADPIVAAMERNPYMPLDIAGACGKVFAALAPHLA